MSAFGTELARLMAARGLGVRELARQVPCNPGHISNLRSGRAQPSAGLADGLDKALGRAGRWRRWLPCRAGGGWQGRICWLTVMRSQRWSWPAAPGRATWATA
ncbi:MAG TPA: helix-turn-helix transcriptional regulator [Streptosporangiaceae bacterium]|nr:helix-turn-helix transcriptional regulator [Streptosporangiaceae bacterium]